MTPLGGSLIATTILLEESPDTYLYNASCIFVPVDIFTRLLLTMVTCILIMSGLGQIKNLLRLLLYDAYVYAVWWYLNEIPEIIKCPLMCYLHAVGAVLRLFQSLSTRQVVSDVKNVDIGVGRHTARHQFP